MTGRNSDGANAPSTQMGPAVVSSPWSGVENQVGLVVCSDIDRRGSRELRQNRYREASRTNGFPALIEIGNRKSGYPRAYFGRA